MKKRQLGFLLLVLLCCCLSCKQEFVQGVLIESINIVSPEKEEIARNKFVWVKDGRIASITDKKPALLFAPDSIINGVDKYLIPGLIDAHVHLYGIPGMNGRLANANPALRDSFRAQLPGSYLYYGFTTLIDLGERFGVESVLNAPVHPDIYHCDYPLTQANGYGMTFDTGPERYDEQPNFLWDDRQLADIPRKFKKQDHTPAANVKRVWDNGGKIVKVKYEDGFGGIFNWPNPDEKTIREVVSESHSKGLPVALHANSIKAYEFGLATNVDILAHGLWHWGELDNQKQIPEKVKGILNQVAERKIGIMPTMRVIYGERDFLSKGFLNDTELANVVPQNLLSWYKTDQAKWYEPELNELYESNEKLIARKFGYTKIKESKLPIIDVYIYQLNQSIAYLARKNAVFLFGSDTPSGPSYTNPAGYNSLLEIQHLLRAGLSLHQLFQALTINNAHALHLDNELGTVEAGKKAHLLIVDKNPLETAEAYNSIQQVILHGRVYERNYFKAK